MMEDGPGREGGGAMREGGWAREGRRRGHEGGRRGQGEEDRSGSAGTVPSL